MSVIRYLTRKLNLSETKQAIIENLYWSVMGKVVTLLSGLIVGIIVARYLGPEKYGLMNYVISYVFLFHIFAVFGLDAIEIREEARKAESYQKIIGTAFTLKVAFALVFMVLTILTSWLMDGNPYTTLLIAIYSLTIVLNAFNVIRNYFLAIVQNEYIVKAEIARTMIGIAIKLLLLVMHVSLTWFIAAYMLDVLLLSTGYIMAYRKKIGRMKEWTFDVQYARFFIRESF